MAKVRPDPQQEVEPDDAPTCPRCGMRLRWDTGNWCVDPSLPTGADGVHRVCPVVTA